MLFNVLGPNVRLATLLVISACLGNSVLATDVSYNPVVSDLFGDTIDSIPTGSEFYLTVYVEDQRDVDPIGVFSAFTNVTYDSTLVESVDPITHSSFYPNAKSGSVLDGQLFEAGGVSGPNSLDGESYEVFRVKMTSGSTVGDLTFATTSVADQINHPTLLYGGNDPITDIDFGSVTLNIVPEPGGLVLLFTCGLAALGLRRRT
ncbi:MAG: PEP-CTERM sorting domain-containing protein [Planctomycetota bacterium]